MSKTKAGTLRPKGAVCGSILILAGFVLSASPAAAHHVMGGRLPVTFIEGLLSGLGHPVIGLDHFAAVIVVGCLAASLPRGALLTAGFVIAMMGGVTLHVAQATIPAGEALAALSVVALGLVMLRARPASSTAALGLFVLTGLFHGYALGESIVGAEPAPLYAYLAGLAIIQSLIALGAMTAVRWLSARDAFAPIGLRLAGAAIAGFGFALFAQQLGA
ncbi:HupE/UreJ family protein [Bradyrhizobium sp.]|uniref:HupE/UreJ family protein n=1 Tax=Bradyrhizobium sp. TaxID=376 RepID=UPI002D441708|nr:HupE/UreJ family protein [Bradyrhizobium sp.]HZR73955.1 HupE/UreJ family protein [Bradyrhizobium sp.]